MRVFKGSVIRQQLQEDELKGLESDFRHHKTTGQLPETFGRDVP